MRKRNIYKFIYCELKLKSKFYLTHMHFYKNWRTFKTYNFNCLLGILELGYKTWRFLFYLSSGPENCKKSVLEFVLWNIFSF